MIVSVLLALVAALVVPGPAADAQTAHTPIPEIQGDSHLSPLDGQDVVTGGVVTAVAFSGFYMQDPVGDGDRDTSDGIFVFTDGAPGVTAGDLVEVAGTVSEFIPGGPDTGNLSVTQISGSATVTSSGNPLPRALEIGLARTCLLYTSPSPRDS